MKFRKHKGSLDEEKLFENISKDDCGMIKKFTLGVCAMESKVESAPMECILKRLAKSGDFNIIKFKEDMILNQDIDSWPIVDCLIAFYSTGFPLKKAIEYVKKYKPITLNNLEKQLILRSRLQIYEQLKKWRVPHANYVVVDHDTVKKGEHVFEEYYDYIVYDNIRLNKPFIEKPINADNHNNWIYYPKNTGGGCKKLFRKIKDRSSEYCPDIHKVRNNGTYIYEEFMSTFGTDIKVYTVGQMFAHAEARKAPSLDGKVCRTSDGKEVRYAVILSEAEKIIAYRIVEAFQQTVCGFDILRTTMGPFVCDVNGWSFVKGNVKYYNDCAHILRAMFLAKLEEKYNIIPRDLADNWYNIENEEEVLRKTFRQPDDLHCSHHEELCSVIIVMRHGDRKPKQKMKFITDKPLLLDYFNCEENLYNVIENRSSIDDNIKINHELDSNIVSVNNIKYNKMDSSLFTNDTLTKINSKQNKNTSNSQKNVPNNNDMTKMNEINNDKITQEDKSSNDCENEKKNNNDNNISEKNNSKIETSNENDTKKLNNKDSPHNKALKDNTTTQSEEIKKNNLYKAYMKKEIKFKSPEELQDLFLINNIILNDIEKEYKAIKEKIFKIQEKEMEEKTKKEKRKENDDVCEMITLKEENINDKELADRSNIGTMTKEELETKRNEYEIMIENHKTLQKILERGDGFTGINRKIQLKPLDLVIVNDKVIVTKILVVAKWGGELTRMGRRQSENLGKRFRATLYPGDSDGLLRLHSTFRHDFKIFTSDEGRCQITSAAFTKGFLDLDGELTPILVAMVIRNSKAHSLLDDNRPNFERIQCKEFIDNVLNENKDIDDDLLKKLASGKHSRGFRESLKKISNFYELMEKIRNTIYEFLKSLNQEVQKWLNLFPYDEYALYVIDILHEIQVRWKSLTKMWFKKNKNKYDTSKIPDIVDNVRFDLIHHHSYLGSGLDKAFEIYNLIEPLANYISQAEYGITSEEKVKIGVNIVGKLLRKLIHDVTFYRDEEERNKKNNKGNNVFKNAFHISYMNPFNFSKNDELKKEKNEEEKDSFKNFNMCKYDSKRKFLDNFLFKKENNKIEKENYENENKNTRKLNSEKSVSNSTNNDTASNLNNNKTEINSLNNMSNGNNNPNDQNVLKNVDSDINESKEKIINNLHSEKRHYIENSCYKNTVKIQSDKINIDKEISEETNISSGMKDINSSISEEKKKERTEKSCLLEEKQELEAKIMKNTEEYISKNNTDEIEKNIFDCDLVNAKCLEKRNETNSEQSYTKSIANKTNNMNNNNNNNNNNNSTPLNLLDANLNENTNDLNNYKSSVTYNTNVKDLYTPKLINKKEALVINSSDLWAHQNKYRKENNEKQKMKKMKSTKENEFNEKKEGNNENNAEQKFSEKTTKQDDDIIKEIKEKKKTDKDIEEEREKGNENENDNENEDGNENENENEQEKEEEDEGEEEQEHDDDEDIIRLKETDARRLGIRSPWRMVRSRYYVTSASHMISLLNILIHAKNTDNSINQNIIDNDSIKSMGDVTDLHYLSHLVFRVWERKQLKRNDNNRFRIEILFSSGAKDGFGQNYELLEKDAKAQQQKYERHFNKYFDDNKKVTGAKNDTPENENKINVKSHTTNSQNELNKKSELEEQKNVKNDTIYESNINNEDNLKIENKIGYESNINNENKNLNKYMYKDINFNAKNNQLKETEMKNEDAQHLKNFNKIDNSYKNSIDILNENSSSSSFLNSSINAKEHTLKNNISSFKYSNSIDEIILNSNKKKNNLNYEKLDIEKKKGILHMSSNSSLNSKTFNSCNDFKREKEEKKINLINKREMSIDIGSINEKKSTDNNNLNISGGYMVRSISSNLRKKNKQKDNLKLDYEKKEKEDITKENLLTYENDCINLGSEEISRKSCRRSFSCLSDRSFYKTKKEDELNDDQKRKNNMENRVNLLENEKMKNKFENNMVHNNSGNKKANVFSHVFQHFNENKKNSTSNLNFFYKTYMPDYEKIIENDKKVETFDVPPYCELAPLIVLTKNCQLSTFENILTQVLNKYSKSTKNKEKSKTEKKVI